MTDNDSTQLFILGAHGANVSVLAPRQKVGNYIIERVLGVGGFGIVYLASHGYMDRKVAIKEFFPALMAIRDNTATVRLATEAYAADFDKLLNNFLLEANNLTRV